MESATSGDFREIRDIIAALVFESTRCQQGKGAKNSCECSANCRSSSWTRANKLAALNDAKIDRPTDQLSLMATVELRNFIASQTKSIQLAHFKERPQTLNSLWVAMRRLCVKCEFYCRRVMMMMILSWLMSMMQQQLQTWTCAADIMHRWSHHKVCCVN